MMRYRENISSLPTILPTYNDGCFKLYKIAQTDSVYPEEYIKLITESVIWFKELSISDKLRFEAEQREIDLTMKIRIPQIKQISSMNVLKIGNEYHKVYNTYHFVNNEGYKETDLTLQKYPNVRLESDMSG